MPDTPFRTPDEVSFWARVECGELCWNWQGTLVHKYGSLTWQGRTWRAHRLAWVLTYGAIPSGLCVLHRCDNPRCVRPGHLFLGTQADNNRDRDEKGRRAGPSGEQCHNAILTAGKAKDVARRIRLGQTHAAIAEGLGITLRSVDHVASGRTWKHLGLPNMRRQERMEPEKVRAIRAERIAGGTVSGIARKYGLAKSSVSHICNYQRWANV